MIHTHEPALGVMRVVAQRDAPTSFPIIQKSHSDSYKLIFFNVDALKNGKAWYLKSREVEQW